MKAIVHLCSLLYMTVSTQKCTVVMQWLLDTCFCDVNQSKKIISLAISFGFNVTRHKKLKKHDNPVAVLKP